MENITEKLLKSMQLPSLTGAIACYIFYRLEQAKMPYFTCTVSG